MKINVPTSQLNYYHENKLLTLTDYLKEDEVATLLKYKIGYDLWRNHLPIRKILLSRSLTRVLFQITRANSLQLLYDKVIGTEDIDLSITSFQGIVIGVLFYPQDNEITLFSPTIDICSEKPGILAVYGTNVRYVFQEKDPHTHDLKRKGYVYGDRLKSEDFPFITHT